MYSDTAREIVDIQSKLASERSTYDAHCKEVAELLLPRQDDFYNEYKQDGEKRSNLIINSMPQRALEKFAAAMESILTPRNSRWHGLRPKSRSIAKNQKAMEYMDEVRDTLFTKRYSNSANYSSQQHECYMSLGAFGTSVLILEQDMVNKGFIYKSSHISQHFLMENRSGIIDVDYRKYRLTARQALETFGEKTPDKIKKAVEKEPNRKFEFINCVRPNDEYMAGSGGLRGMKFMSYHVLFDGGELIEVGGYRTFPFIISRYVTSPNEIYGRSPGMTALSEMKMINEVRKSDLRARHMAIDHPVLTSSDRTLRRPIINPGSINRGALDSNGNPLIKPYNNNARVDVSNDLMQQSYELINDIFLVTLFQILVDSPQMTATEVLQRAQEKGALLSPTAGRQQSEALGRMIEREIDILSYMGEIDTPPRELLDLLEEGEEFEYEIEYTSPLNAMQKSGAAAAAQRVVETAIPLSQIDPSIMDKIDLEEFMNIVHEASGADSKLLRSNDEVIALRDEREQQQQMQQLINSAPQVAGAIKDISQAQAYDR